MQAQVQANECMLPQLIKYTHSDISYKFQPCLDKNGHTTWELRETLLQLCDGTIGIADIPPIVVVEYEDMDTGASTLWVLDGHRRLYIFKILEHVGLLTNVPVRMVNDGHTKFTTCCLGESVWVREVASSYQEEFLQELTNLAASFAVEGRSLDIAEISEFCEGQVHLEERFVVENMEYLETEMMSPAPVSQQSPEPEETVVHPTKSGKKKRSVAFMAGSGDINVVVQNTQPQNADEHTLALLSPEREIIKSSEPGFSPRWFGPVCQTWQEDIEDLTIKTEFATNESASEWSLIQSSRQ